MEPGEGIIERLDEHFRPHQERYAAFRREQEERAAQQREHSDKLDAEIAERNEREYRAVWGLPAAS